MASFATSTPPTGEQPKYIFDNGVMKMNPAYRSPTAQGPPPSYAASVNQPLAVVTSMADAQHFTGCGEAFQMSASTTTAMNEMQTPEYQVIYFTYIWLII
jgi:hypothetical protein